MKHITPIFPTQSPSSFSHFRPTRKKVVKKKKTIDKSLELEPSSDWTIDDIIDFEKETGVDLYDTRESFVNYY